MATVALRHDGALRRALSVCSPWTEFALHMCIYASFLIFYIFEMVKMNTDKFSVWFPDYTNMKIMYKGTTSQRLSAYYVMNLILTCVPLVGGTIIVTATRRLPRDKPSQVLRRFKRGVRHVLDWQLPPRRFFSWWCGGMSVLDATLTAFMLAASLYTVLEPVVSTRRERVLPLHRVGLIGEDPPFYRYLETAALYFGFVLFWWLWLLFLPLPHMSFLHTLTGIDYAGWIRYHRWLGHGAMVVTSLHAICYYVLWTYQGQFLYEFRDWSSHSSINILAGSISWFGGVLLWATSIDWVRRKHFETFYIVHLLGFVVYTLFACIHWQGSWNMFFPGLVLWMVDLVQRQSAFATVTTPVDVKVNASGNTADIKLPNSHRSKGCPISHIYLLIPSISRFQWHPFSVRTQDATGDLHLSVKDTGSFTKALVRRLADGERIDMRVLAPYDLRHPVWEAHDSVVVGAGGVGVTGAWNVLSALAAERANRKASGRSMAGLPRSVCVVWTARYPDEFFTLESWVAEALEDPDRWLHISLHCTTTKALESAEGVPETQAGKILAVDSSSAFEALDVSRSGSASSSAGKLDKGCGSSEGSPDGLIRASDDAGSGSGKGMLASSSSEAGLASLAGQRIRELEMTTPQPVRRLPGATVAGGRQELSSAMMCARWGDSPLFFRALRRIQPGGSGDMVWVLYNLLAFFGAIMTLLCVASFSAEYNRAKAVGGKRVRNNSLYWRQGMLNLIASCVGGFGFPFFWIAGPMHIVRYVVDRYHLSKRHPDELLTPAAFVPGPRCAISSTAVRVGDTDVVLPILPGRPDLGAVLDEAQGPVVGVYASGPEPMNHALRLAAQSRNSPIRKVYYDFREMTTFL